MSIGNHPSTSLSRLTISRRLHALALLCYVGFACLILNALLLLNGTHTAGYDFFNYNWNFWWIRHALHTPGLDVYENNFVMFPAMTNYGYHVLAMAWYPLWALLEPLVGTLTAVNAIILLSCVGSGWALFVLLRSEGVAPDLALIGGLALQALPITRYFYYNTHLNLMTWFWLPILILFWRGIARQVEVGRTLPALLWGVVFGTALWGLLLTDLQYPIFAAFLLVPVGMQSAWRLRRPGKIARLALAALTAAVVGAALMWLAGPLPYIVRFEGTLAPGSVEDRPGIPLSGFVSMDAEWWSWSRPSLGAFVTVAVLVALALCLLRRARQCASDDRWFWFALMIPPLLLALGPTLRLGEVEIALPPFRWLHALTDGNFRMPWRLAPVAVIAAMLFVGLTLTAWLRTQPMRRSVRVWGGAAALLALSASVRLFETAPLEPVPYPYRFYEAMGRERGQPYDDYVVIEVPTAAGTGEALFGDPAAIQYQWYGITHGKRMLNGFISRAPIENIWYIVTDDPMLSWLGQRRQLEADAVREQMRERIFGYPIGYFILHLERIGLNGSTPQEIVGYFNQLDDLVCPLWIERDAVVYRTAWHPDGCPRRTPPEVGPGVYRVDIGSADDWRYIGWGWHWREPVAGIDWRWTGAPAIDGGAARLYVDLPPGDYTVTVNVQAFWEARALRVLVSGAPLDPAGGVRAAADALQAVTFTLPADLVAEGRHIELRLESDAALVPAEVGQSGDERPLALAVESITFRRTP